MINERITFGHRQMLDPTDQDRMIPTVKHLVTTALEGGHRPVDEWGSEFSRPPSDTLETTLRRVGRESLRDGCLVSRKHVHRERIRGDQPIM